MAIARKKVAVFDVGDLEMVAPDAKDICLVGSAVGEEPEVAPRGGAGHGDVEGHGPRRGREPTPTGQSEAALLFRTERRPVKGAKKASEIDGRARKYTSDDKTISVTFI